MDTPIIYDPIQYDKISDDIMFLGRSAILRMNVALSKKRRSDEMREFFYNEYEYGGAYNRNVMVRRSFDYYLSVDSLIKLSPSMKEKVIIGLEDMYSFKAAIDTAISWFRDPEHKGLFVFVSGEMKLTAPIPNVMLNNLRFGKWLRIEPAVSYESNYPEQGVRIYINNDEMYTTFGLDTLFALDYILKSINIFNAAQLMVASLNIPMGTNRSVIGSSVPSYAKERQEFEDRSKTVARSQRLIGKARTLTDL